MTRQSALLMCAVALGGCSGQSALPPPASHEFLSGCVYTLYKNGYESGPSGILVTKRNGTATSHMILTAGHVVRETVAQMKTSGKCYLGFQKATDANAVRRISAPADFVTPFLHPAFPREDLGLLSVRDLEAGVASNGGRIRAIGLDSPFERGVGVVRDDSDYEKFGIGIGTAVFAFCSDISRPLGNLGYDWSRTVIERNGIIRDLHAKISAKSESPKCSAATSQSVIMADFPSVNGNSGGPVFAYGNVNGVRYPILLGVISGRPEARPGWAAIAPIGPIVKEIEQAYK